jgi:glycosyltransferase involved in cell wall biosynthesis
MTQECHVQVVQHLSPGGLETMVLELMRHASEKLNCQIVALEGTRIDAYARWPRLIPFDAQLHFLNKAPGLSPLALSRTVRLLKRLRATAVHTHHIGPLLYGGLAARLSGVRVLVHTEHDAWHLQSPQRRRLQDRVIGLVRPTLVADSEIVNAELARLLPRRNYRVIPNGIDCARFDLGNRAEARRQFGLPEDQKLIGCASRMELVKGHDRLLKAHALLPPDVHLALAGNGSLEQEVWATVRRLGTADRVHFLGHIDDMPAFYQALDLFCLPSEMEGMPLAPLEAQACGIPCVATEVGGVREAVCPETGILVPATTPDHLARGLSVGLSVAPGVKVREFVLQNADLRTVATAYQSLLNA